MARKPESENDRLDDAARAKTRFDVDSDEWRDWHNVHRAPREGVSFGMIGGARRVNRGESGGRNAHRGTLIGRSWGMRQCISPGPDRKC